VQFENPDYEGGANRISLREAQTNFIKTGACEPDALAQGRKPIDGDERDAGWKPLTPLAR
jgi:cysteine-rich CPCC protein